MRLDRHTHPLEPPVYLKRELHPYAHGAGFGIATEILSDSYLADALEIFEPQRFRKCEQILQKHKRVLNFSCAKKIVQVLENSSVVAALAQIKFGPIPLEWDLWLDPQEPSSLENAAIEHGSVAAMAFGRFSCLSSLFLKDAPSASCWVRIYREALYYFSSFSRCDPEQMPSICLDIKSPWSTASDINLFTQSLKETLGIDVCYVGSFSYRQIAAVQGPEKILFCHALWDLKEQVLSGNYPSSCMLNGADLLKQSHLDSLRELAFEHSLKIGIYIQESEAETEAIQNLIDMVNLEPELFSLGFALGNSCDGKASRMIKGSGAGLQKYLLTDSALIKIEQAAMRIWRLTTSIFHLAFSNI